MRQASGYIMVVLIISSAIPIYAASPDKTGTNFLVIDTFSSCIDSKTNLACGWRATRNDVSMYSMERDRGNYFVRIQSRRGYTAIGKRIEPRGAGMHYLRWRWRVHTLPEGAKESDKKKADSGAGVYVVFNDPFKLNSILKYVWSTTLPRGTVTRSPYSSRTRIIVLESGNDSLGTWVTEKVNVYDDFKKVFSAPAPEIAAIGIMSDADNTRSYAEADYDDFYLENR